VVLSMYTNLSKTMSDGEPTDELAKYVFQRCTNLDKWYR
jgi:hypothetical protein